MARWEPDAAGRLQRAALELFREQGFEATTVAQIAERAGVTERTFFRHHTDKREVLFAGSEELVERLVQGIESAPAEAAPVEALSRSFAMIDDLFGARRAFVRERHAAVASSRELRERELAKLAALSHALAEALRSRGAADDLARLLGEVGVAVFTSAFERWVVEDDGDLGALVQDSFAQLSHAINRPASSAQTS